MTGRFKPDDIGLSGPPRAKSGSEAGAAALRSYEHNLAKVGVEGSNPFARSKNRQLFHGNATAFRGRRCLHS
jgi:hypothetical protein